MVLGHIRKSSTNSPRASTEVNDHDEDETVVTSEQGSVLTHIISQLRPGADLSRVTLPTFILEPRSMLERITNFMAHPDTLLPMPDIDDPVKRFVAVTKFYLSGWHIKPPGVKKPLNPILGETFTSYWDYPDGTRGYYISEQTSHHPPKSSYFFMSPEHHIRIDGTLKPRSKFLGNSVGSFMEGIAVMRFSNRNERYFVTQPNMYARGILFGKMKYELGDHAVIRCPETGLEADIEFKVKGWVAGTYNAIGGIIKESSTGKNLYELSGLWHGEMFIKDLSSGRKEVLFDATHAKASYPKARPLHQQGPRESQRLWDSTTKAIKRADQKVATDEKSRIEDEQRKEAAERGEHNWQPKFFQRAPSGDEEQLDWILNTEINTKVSAAEQVKQILAIAPILPDEESNVTSEQPASRQELATEDASSASTTTREPQTNTTSANTSELPIRQSGSTSTATTAPPVGQLSNVGDATNDTPVGNTSELPLAQSRPQTQMPQAPTTQQQRPLQSSRKDRIVRLDSTTGGEELFTDAEM